MDISLENTRPTTLSKKRRRGDDVSSTASSSEPLLDPLQPNDLKPYNCSRKIRDMDPEMLVGYFPSLPERTQYLDMGKLVTARLIPSDYYADRLRLWRAVSTSQSDFDA